MMCRCLFLLWLFPWAASAAVNVIDARTQTRLNPSAYTVSEGWNRDDDKGRLLVYGASIDFKDAALLQNISTVEGGDVFTSKGSKKVVVGARTAIVKSAEGRALLKIEWVPERKGIFYTRCQTKIFSFRLDRKNETLDYPIAVNCELDANPPRFTISVPEEVKWVDYSFTEVQGKGERTRMFELPSGNLVTDKVGEFTFSRDDKIVKLPIVVKTLAEDEGSAQGLAFEKSLALGTSTINYGATESYSAQSFMLKFKGMSGYFLQALKFNMQIKNSFNMSDDPKAITLTDIGLGVGYFKTWGSFEVGLTGQYRYLDYLHLASQGRMQSSQMGVLLTGVYRSGSHRVHTDISMASFGSKIIQSHMDIVAGYSYLVKLFGGSTWLGFEYEMQTVTASDEAGNSRKFDDTSILLSFSF